MSVLARARSAIRFGLVGASGVAVNQALIWVLVERCHVHYLVAGALSTAGSTTSNFLLLELCVFSRRARSGLLRRYLGFGALSVASLPLRLPVLFLLTSVLSMHYLVSNLAALGVTFLARFLVSDQLIWPSAAPRPQEVVEL